MGLNLMMARISVLDLTRELASHPHFGSQHLDGSHTFTGSQVRRGSQVDIGSHLAQGFAFLSWVSTLNGLAAVL